jgi:uncharacterized coiled-coil protein SlyX
MNHADATDNRLVRLEEKLAYQDKTIAELNDMVVRLHRGVDALSKRLEAVERTLRSDLAGRDMPIEKPPHY